MKQDVAGLFVYGADPRGGRYGVEIFRQRSGDLAGRLFYPDPLRTVCSV
ncbi:MAG: hypothetical protein NWF14_08400 [Candidatus Bathyarchaeota archaeon]|nr:hypothetical protein [Candidatus Bathyarchaeota archaeon]